MEGRDHAGLAVRAGLAVMCWGGERRHVNEPSMLRERYYDDYYVEYVRTSCVVLAATAVEYWESAIACCP